MIDLMDMDSVITRTTSVLIEASMFARDPHTYRTGVFGRSQVIHYAMSLLVSWVFSQDGNEDALFSSNGLLKWLRNLLLDDHDPAVRREVCTGLYKLCLGSTPTGSKTGSSCTAPLLSVLLEFLDDALAMKPVRRQDSPNHLEQDGKEPYGPACRDYFWILCRLVDNLPPEVDHSSNSGSGSSLVDLDQLARQLACGVVSRKLHEKRHGDNSPDDTLVGAIQLLCYMMKHQPPFKSSPEGQEFLLHLLECLFALPSPREKHMPKCKSVPARTACYDLLVEMTKGSLVNYLLLHKKLIEQHSANSHKPYPWEHWPKDDGRSECGYVGLTNLGATCYMATCVQQLYMIPEARSGILTSSVGAHPGNHPMTLQELQRMFAYLRDSERKAYNPLSFCKTYEMDHQPLNTGEQKDMAEFFINLLSKMEDMSPELKISVKDLFCGTQTNNVVSLDCNHVSRTAEEFYTVRCQVSEMRNLYQSLEEVTVKDTLEGDNMYTCSHCNKKVRAEKRACFKKLPKILAFNTMRYTFNMVTMLKEKVNTHFSFPFRLDMLPYMEHNLIPKDKEEMSDDSQKFEKDEKDENPSYEYELIGVTVHTGTADGGHYYAFIRDRSTNKDKWYSFNDAEVKPFDPNQIASECFGGEMNSRTYDQVTDKFMDLSIEKTNSAYMLFYERVEPIASTIDEAGPSEMVPTSTMMINRNSSPMKTNNQPTLDLSQALEDWIWEDNMNFIQDNNIFDHTYFNFMWQMVSHVPNTLNPKSSEDITLLAAKLSTSFFLESFIHAKEKLNIVQWVELLTKQFDSSTAACSWFLSHMADDSTWPITIFLRCHVATIRQMFHRLCIHVIQKLRDMEKGKYLLPWNPQDPTAQPPDEKIRTQIGIASPITRYVRTVLGLLESGAARAYLKHVTELFRFLYDFAKLGDEEAKFLLSINTISVFVEFYLRAIRQSPEGGVSS
jgi:ubiquitin carboxyl-terminal hydrolase 34